MRGLGPSLIKNTLTSGTYFSMLYTMDQHLRQLNMLNQAQLHFFSSSMARTIQSIISNPIIIIKTRFEVIGFNEYNSITNACQMIYRTEGLGGFFTGLKVSLVRDVPFSGIFYPIYNMFKRDLVYLYEAQQGIPTHEMTKSQRLQQLAIISAIASFSANIASCTLTHPIDLIRTRIFF